MNSIHRLCQECNHIYVFSWDKDGKRTQAEFHGWNLDLLIHKVNHMIGRKYGDHEAKTNSGVGQDSR